MESNIFESLFTAPSTDLSQPNPSTMPANFIFSPQAQMSSVVNLTVKGVKRGYALYKKHRAEKELRQRGSPVEVEDPSYEFDAVPYSSELDGDHQSLPPQEIGSSMLQDRNWSNSSRTSLSSTMVSMAMTEDDAELENDVEFQRFMRWQKQMYLQRQRQRQQHRATGEAGVDVSVQPPTYDFVMTQECPYDGGQSSRSSSVDSRGPVYSDIDVPVLNVHAEAGAAELDGVAFAPGKLTPPVGGVNELPAVPSRRTRRHVAELPVTLM